MTVIALNNMRHIKIWRKGQWEWWWSWTRQAIWEAAISCTSLLSSCPSLVVTRDDDLLGSLWQPSGHAPPNTDRWSWPSCWYWEWVDCTPLSSKVELILLCGDSTQPHTVKCTTHGGKTALHLASQQNHWHTLELRLVHLSIKADLVNSQGETRMVADMVGKLVKGC